MLTTLFLAVISMFQADNSNNIVNTTWKQTSTTDANVNPADEITIQFIDYQTVIYSVESKATPNTHRKIKGIYKIVNDNLLTITYENDPSIYTAQFIPSTKTLLVTSNINIVQIYRKE